MKKSLLALAAMGAFTGAAQAQSSVTVYGVLDLSYGIDQVDQGQVAASSKSTGLADNRNGTSRLGFRGVEDLGGGMQAGFVLESGLNIANGATINKSNGQTTTAATGSNTSISSDSAVFGAATRQAFVTLGTKGAGTLLVGYKKLLESDFNDNFVLGTENTYGSEGQELNRLGRGNTVSYTSPTFNGVALSVANTSQVTAYDLAATDAASKIGVSINQINLSYSDAKLLVQAHAGVGQIDAGTAFTTGTLGLNLSFIGAGAPGNGTYNTSGIGARYDFGVARLAAMYGKRETGVKDSSQLDTVYSAVSAAIPFGKNAVKLTYSMSESKNKSDNITSKNGGFQVVGEHNLSKRSQIWAIYGYNKVEAVTAAAAVTSVSPTVSAANENKQTSIRIGMTHTF
jgi:predicted porin